MGTPEGARLQLPSDRTGKGFLLFIPTPFPVMISLHVQHVSAPRAAALTFPTAVPLRWRTKKIKRNYSKQSPSGFVFLFNFHPKRPRRDTRPCTPIKAILRASDENQRTKHKKCKHAARSFYIHVWCLTRT